VGEHRVALHLHPDWPFGDEMVVEALARDGRYVSQFVTGTSNGGLTAFPGGDRWRWESRIFAGRYDAAAAAERPVYGALLSGDPPEPYGASVRFGSAHLRLRPEVTARSTFCWPDSVFEPTETGGPERAAELAALCAASPAEDPLDHYVEAHVHGGVRLDTDVEALVLDPSHRGGPVEEAAARLGCPVEWHPGFRVATAGLPEHYRGPGPLALARSLGPVLTPPVVAVAARSGEHDPQAVKRVWHLLARYGRSG
jgi:hypothetical protein